MSWVSAAEVAERRLPGLPQTTRGVRLYAAKNGWSASPGKVKKIGNRLFYHKDLLPAPAAIEAKIADAVASAAVSNSSARRRDARLWILQHRDNIKRRNGFSEKVATATLCERWNCGELAAPSWVGERVKKLSPPTIHRWLKMRYEGDMVGLGGNYGTTPRGALTLNNDAGRTAAALALKNPALTSRHIYDFLKGKGYNPPNPRSVCRFLRTMRTKNREAVLYLTDPDAFKGKMRVAGNNRYANITKPNELWEIDASPADVLLEQGRHSIYVLVDVATRRLAVLVTKTPKTQAALLLVRKAIKAWGVPELLRTDNGKDFVSNHFKKALAALGISQELCPPFMPERKGLVERHIHTIQHGLMPILPGYIGHNVAERQQIRERAAFAKRLGDTDDHAFCVKLSRDKFQETVDAWLKYKYERRRHQGLKGKTPFQAATEYRGKLKRLGNDRVLDLLLAPVAGQHGWRTVTKQGIRSEGRQFYHGALIPGNKVFCRHDPHDMGKLYVFDGAERFLCVAEDPKFSGIDPRAAVAAVRLEQRRRVKAEVDPLKREINRLSPYALCDTLLEQAKVASSNVEPFPSPAERHGTPTIAAVTEAVSQSPPAPSLAEKEDTERRAKEMLAGMESEKVISLPIGRGGRPYFGLGEDLQWARWLMEHPESATNGDIERLNQWLDNPINSERVDEEEWGKLVTLAAEEKPQVARVAGSP